MARRPSSHTVLSPALRRVVAALFISAGILLTIGELLRLYVLLAEWHKIGVLGAGPLAGVLLGLGAGVLTTYMGWRIGKASGTS